MKDELVSYELAVALKEIGFHSIRCETSFGIDKTQINIPSQNLNGDLNLIARPTQSLAQRWFREMRDLYVFVNFDLLVEGIFRFKIDTPSELIYEEIINHFSTYEEALEIGLLEACKLIKK